MPLPAAQPPATTGFSFPRETISRGNDFSVEIELCQGDISGTPSEVILLGQIQGLDPTSPAVDLDDAMDGGLFRLLAQRNVARGAGALDIIPTGRFPIMADFIAFLGLGKWEDFTGDTLIAACRSAMRTLLTCSFDEFSTTLMGGRRPGQRTIDEGDALCPMLRGFLEALHEDPQRNRFRRIVIVEQRVERLQEIQRVLRRFVRSDDGFAGVRTTLFGSHLRFRRITALERPAPPTDVQSNLLNLAMTPLPGDRLAVVAMLQPARGSGAVVLKQTEEIEKRRISALYEAAGVSTGYGVKTPGQLAEVSAQVGALLPAGIGAPLDLFPPEAQDEPRLELIHDAEASRVPWEALRLADGRQVALLGGISRRFVSESPRSLWLPPPAAKLRLLMVIDPTGELRDARREGENLRSHLAELAEITYLTGPQASHKVLTELLNDTPFDVLHFAGHGGFNRQDPRSSGLKLAGGAFFTARDALALKRFPPMLVFNCCEMARIERLDPVVEPKDAPSRAIIANRDQAHGAISLAEAFLIAGVHHYIGTFWPVQDHAAALFGETLLGQVARGLPVGRAVTLARRLLAANQLPDWANYIHYGAPGAPLRTAGDFPPNPN